MTSQPVNKSQSIKEKIRLGIFEKIEKIRKDSPQREEREETDDCDYSDSMSSRRAPSATDLAIVESEKSPRESCSAGHWGATRENSPRPAPPHRNKPLKTYGSGPGHKAPARLKATSPHYSLSQTDDLDGALDSKESERVKRDAVVAVVVPSGGQGKAAAREAPDDTQVNSSKPFTVQSRTSGEESSSCDIDRTGDVSTCDIINTADSCSELTADILASVHHQKRAVQVFPCPKLALRSLPPADKHPLICLKKIRFTSDMAAVKVASSAAVSSITNCQSPDRSAPTSESDSSPGRLGDGGNKKLVENRCEGQQETVPKPNRVYKSYKRKLKGAEKSPALAVPAVLCADNNNVEIKLSESQTEPKKAALDTSLGAKMDSLIASCLKSSPVHGSGPREKTTSPKGEDKVKKKLKGSEGPVKRKKQQDSISRVNKESTACGGDSGGGVSRSVQENNTTSSTPKPTPPGRKARTGASNKASTQKREERPATGADMEREGVRKKVINSNCASLSGAEALFVGGSCASSLHDSPRLERAPEAGKDGTPGPGKGGVSPTVKQAKGKSKDHSPSKHSPPSKSSPPKGGKKLQTSIERKKKGTPVGSPQGRGHTETGTETTPVGKPGMGRGAKGPKVAGIKKVRERKLPYFFEDLKDISVDVVYAGTCEDKSKLPKLPLVVESEKGLSATTTTTTPAVGPPPPLSSPGPVTPTSHDVKNIIPELTPLSPTTTTDSGHVPSAPKSSPTTVSAKAARPEQDNIELAEEAPESKPMQSPVRSRSGRAIKLTSAAIEAGLAHESTMSFLVGTTTTLKEKLKTIKGLDCSPERSGSSREASPEKGKQLCEAKANKKPVAANKKPDPEISSSSTETSPQATSPTIVSMLTSGTSGAGVITHCAVAGKVTTPPAAPASRKKRKKTIRQLLNIQEEDLNVSMPAITKQQQQQDSISLPKKGKTTTRDISKRPGLSSNLEASSRVDAPAKPSDSGAEKKEEEEDGLPVTRKTCDSKPEPCKGDEVAVSRSEVVNLANEADPQGSVSPTVPSSISSLIKSVVVSELTGQSTTQEEEEEERLQSSPPRERPSEKRGGAESSSPAGPPPESSSPLIAAPEEGTTGDTIGPSADGAARKGGAEPAGLEAAQQAVPRSVGGRTDDNKDSNAERDRDPAGSRERTPAADTSSTRKGLNANDGVNVMAEKPEGGCSTTTGRESPAEGSSSSVVEYDESYLPPVDVKRSAPLSSLIAHIRGRLEDTPSQPTLLHLPEAILPEKPALDTSRDDDSDTEVEDPNDSGTEEAAHSSRDGSSSTRGQEVRSSSTRGQEVRRSSSTTWGNKDREDTKDSGDSVSSSEEEEEEEEESSTTSSSESPSDESDTSGSPAKKTPAVSDGEESPDQTGSLKTAAEHDEEAQTEREDKSATSGESEESCAQVTVKDGDKDEGISVKGEEEEEEAAARSVEGGERDAEGGETDCDENVMGSAHPPSEMASEASSSAREAADPSETGDAPCGGHSQDDVMFKTPDEHLKFLDSQLRHLDHIMQRSKELTWSKSSSAAMDDDPHSDKASPVHESCLEAEPAVLEGVDTSEPYQQIGSPSMAAGSSISASLPAEQDDNVHAVFEKPGPASKKKASAFVSNELEEYLTKNSKLKQKCTPDVPFKEPPPPMPIGSVPGGGSSSSTEASSSSSSASSSVEPERDEIDGVVIYSFSSQAELEAHVKKGDPPWSPGQAAAAAAAAAAALSSSPSSTPASSVQAAAAPCIVPQAAASTSSAGLFHDQKTPEKTHDVTKIKGWKRKYAHLEESPTTGGAAAAGPATSLLPQTPPPTPSTTTTITPTATPTVSPTPEGAINSILKIHWRTKERLLRNLTTEEINTLGLNLKRRSPKTRAPQPQPPAALPRKGGSKSKAAAARMMEREQGPPAEGLTGTSLTSGRPASSKRSFKLVTLTEKMVKSALSALCYLPDHKYQHCERKECTWGCVCHLLDNADVISIESDVSSSASAEPLPLHFTSTCRHASFASSSCRYGCKCSRPVKERAFDSSKAPDLSSVIIIDSEEDEKEEEAEEDGENDVGDIKKSSSLFLGSDHTERKFKVEAQNPPVIDTTTPATTSSAKPKSNTKPKKKSRSSGSLRHNKPLKIRAGEPCRLVKTEGETDCGSPTAIKVELNQSYVDLNEPPLLPPIDLECVSKQEPGGGMEDECAPHLEAVDIKPLHPAAASSSPAHQPGGGGGAQAEESTQGIEGEGGGGGGGGGGQNNYLSMFGLAKKSELPSSSEGGAVKVRKSSRLKDRKGIGHIDKLRDLIYFDTAKWADNTRTDKKKKYPTKSTSQPSSKIQTTASSQQRSSSTSANSSPGSLLSLSSCSPQPPGTTTASSSIASTDGGYVVRTGSAGSSHKRAAPPPLSPRDMMLSELLQSSTSVAGNSSPSNPEPEEEAVIEVVERTTSSNNTHASSSSSPRHRHLSTNGRSSSKDSLLQKNDFPFEVADDDDVSGDDHDVCNDVGECARTMVYVHVQKRENRTPSSDSGKTQKVPLKLPGKQEMAPQRRMPHVTGPAQSAAKSKEARQSEMAAKNGPSAAGGGMPRIRKQMVLLQWNHANRSARDHRRWSKGGGGGNSVIDITGEEDQEKEQEEGEEEEPEEEDAAKPPHLLEIQANCSWDPIRSVLLNQISVIADRQELPPEGHKLCRRIGDFVVEIRPPAKEPMPLPPNLQTEGCKSLPAIRILITRFNPQESAARSKAAGVMSQRAAAAAAAVAGSRPHWGQDHHPWADRSTQKAAPANRERLLTSVQQQLQEQQQQQQQRWERQHSNSITNSSLMPKLSQAPASPVPIPVCTSAMGLSALSRLNVNIAGCMQSSEGGGSLQIRTGASQSFTYIPNLDSSSPTAATTTTTTSRSGSQILWSSSCASTPAVTAAAASVAGAADDTLSKHMYSARQKLASVLSSQKHRLDRQRMERRASSSASSSSSSSSLSQVNKGGDAEDAPLLSDRESSGGSKDNDSCELSDGLVIQNLSDALAATRSEAPRKRKQTGTSGEQQQQQSSSSGKKKKKTKQDRNAPSNNAQEARGGGGDAATISTIRGKESCRMMNSPIKTTPSSSGMSTIRIPLSVFQSGSVGVGGGAGGGGGAAVVNGEVSFPPSGMCKVTSSLLDTVVCSVSADGSGTSVLQGSSVDDSPAVSDSESQLLLRGKSSRDEAGDTDESTRDRCSSVLEASCLSSREKQTTQEALEDSGGENTSTGSQSLSGGSPRRLSQADATSRCRSTFSSASPSHQSPPYQSNSPGGNGVALWNRPGPRVRMPVVSKVSVPLMSGTMQCGPRIRIPISALQGESPSHACSSSSSSSSVSQASPGTTAISQLASSNSSCSGGSGSLIYMSLPGAKILAGRVCLPVEPVTNISTLSKTKLGTLIPMSLPGAKMIDGKVCLPVEPPPNGNISLLESDTLVPVTLPGARVIQDKVCLPVATSLSDADPSLIQQGALVPVILPGAKVMDGKVCIPVEVPKQSSEEGGSTPPAHSPALSSSTVSSNNSSPSQASSSSSTSGVLDLSKKACKPRTTTPAAVPAQGYCHDIPNSLPDGAFDLKKELPDSEPNVSSKASDRSVKNQWDKESKADGGRVHKRKGSQGSRAAKERRQEGKEDPWLECVDNEKLEKKAAAAAAAAAAGAAAGQDRLKWEEGVAEGNPVKPSHTTADCCPAAEGEEALDLPSVTSSTSSDAILVLSDISESSEAEIDIGSAEEERLWTEQALSRHSDSGSDPSLHRKMKKAGRQTPDGDDLVVMRYSRSEPGRQQHIDRERKRRSDLMSKFERLRSLIPPRLLVMNPKDQPSKQSVLNGAQAFITHLVAEEKRLRREKLKLVTCFERLSSKYKILKGTLHTKPSEEKEERRLQFPCSRQKEASGSSVRSDASKSGSSSGRNNSPTTSDGQTTSSSRSPADVTASAQRRPPQPIKRVKGQWGPASKRRKLPESAEAGDGGSATAVSGATEGHRLRETRDGAEAEGRVNAGSGDGPPRNSPAGETKSGRRQSTGCATVAEGGSGAEPSDGQPHRRAAILNQERPEDPEAGLTISAIYSLADIHDMSDVIKTTSMTSSVTLDTVDADVTRAASRDVDADVTDAEDAAAGGRAEVDQTKL